MAPAVGTVSSAPEQAAHSPCTRCKGAKQHGPWGDSDHDDDTMRPCNWCKQTGVEPAAAPSQAPHPLPTVKCERCEGLGTVMGRHEREWCGVCHATGEVKTTAPHPLDALRAYVKRLDAASQQAGLGNVEAVKRGAEYEGAAQASRMASDDFAAVERERDDARRLLTKLVDALRELCEADLSTDAQRLARAWKAARDLLRTHPKAEG